MPNLHLGIKTPISDWSSLLFYVEHLFIINSIRNTGHGGGTRKPYRASSYLNLNFPASKALEVDSKDNMSSR